VKKSVDIINLRRFGVQNFKAIGEYQEIKIKPINLFFGANNAGKSSMIEAFIYAFELLNGRNFDDVIDLAQTGRKLEAGNIKRYKNIGYGTDKETVFHFYIWVLPLKQDFGLVFSENYFHFFSIEPKKNVTIFYQTHGRFEFDIHHNFINLLKILQSNPFLTSSSSIDIDELRKHNIPGIISDHFRDNNLEFNLHGIYNSFKLHFFDDKTFISPVHIAQDIKKFLIQCVSYRHSLNLSFLISEYPDILNEIKSGKYWINFLDQDEIIESLGYKQRSVLWVGPDRNVPVNRLVYSKSELEKLDSIWGRLFREPTVLKNVNLFLNHQKLLDFGKEIVFQKLIPESANNTSEQNVLYSVKLIDKQNGRYLELNDIGSGSIHIIDVLVGLLSRETHIAIQQPETHLHPALQSRIMEWIVQIYGGNSYFIETHSEHIIKALQLAIAKRETSNLNNKLFPTSDDIGVYYFRYEKNTYQTLIKEMEMDNIGSFKEPWPDDFFDISADLTMERLEHNIKSKN